MFIASFKKKNKLKCQTLKFDVFIIIIIIKVS